MADTGAYPYQYPFLYYVSDERDITVTTRPYRRISVETRAYRAIETTTRHYRQISTITRGY